MGFPKPLKPDVISKLLKVYSRWPKEMWLEILPEKEQDLSIIQDYTQNNINIMPLFKVFCQIYSIYSF